MKKIDLSQTISIVANLGFLIGILLLVYELNQNRTAMQAQTRNAIAETLVNLLALEASTPELMAMEAKLEAGEPLTPAEMRMNANMRTAYQRFRENVYYQYRIGLYEESEYTGQREIWARGLNTSEAERNRWCRSRANYSEMYRNEIDSVLDKPCN